MENKRDYYYQGKIYIDAIDEDFFPMCMAERLNNMKRYPVQGNHSFKDGEDVTGKYNLYNDCELHPGCYCVMNGKDETQCKRYNPVAHEIKADLPLPASKGEGVKEKALELRNKFRISVGTYVDDDGNTVNRYLTSKSTAKKAAIICVDEEITLLKILLTYPELKNNFFIVDEINDLEQLKQNIQTL